MRILIAHNTYQQRGGEDVVFEQESAMLAAAGAIVRRFSVSNDHIHGLAAKVSAARSVFANRSSIAALCAEVATFHPDIVHFHNFFPTLSPGAVAAVVRREIPVVVTLHNYRLICAAALLMRNGKPCESCVGHSKLPGIQYQCYRGSRTGSVMVGAMGLYFKRLLAKNVRALTLLALTNFAKARFVADGFPAESITVRGNCASDPGVGATERDKRIVYIGRLSPEKGVDTLVRAAAGFDGELEIIGTGPDRERLSRLAPSNVIFLGQLEREDVLNRMKSATAVAVPSRWYEGFPMVVIEAMATGTPVVASRIGALEEIIAHDETGVLVAPNDVLGWTQAMRRLVERTNDSQAIGRRGRSTFLARHSTETGVKSLIEIYERAQSRMLRLSVG